MYLLPIGWLYVTLMMALAEATSSNGTMLGAIITFVLYGLLPVFLVVYLIGSPARRKAMRVRDAAISVGDPDAGSHAAVAAQGETVAPVREEK